MKKKIYFKGYFGFKNVGDDIFCVTADWVCNNIWKKKEAIFIGEELPKLSNNSKKYNIKSYWVRKVYEFLILFTSNYIIYFGGSLFSKINGKSDIKYLLSKIKILHPKLGSIGNSIGPFKEKKDYEAIRNLLSNFNFISVRDYSSQRLLNEMELNSISSFSFDTAVLINEVFPSLKKSNRGINVRDIRLAVSLCHYERYVGGDLSKEQEREKSVFDFISHILDNYDGVKEIVFFEFNGSKDKGDLGISKEFQSKLPQKVNTRIVNYTTDTKGFVEELNNCDFLIGMRLHSGILAYTLNIPFLLIEYHNKCTEFLNTINHNYRFDNNNQNNNLNNFTSILNKAHVPGLKDPNEFKNILLNELNRIDQFLLSKKTEN